MVAAAGQTHEVPVALQQHGFGGGRDSGQAEARGQLTLVHVAVGGQVRVFRMLNHERAEAAGVGERAAHHPGVAYGL